MQRILLLLFFLLSRYILRFSGICLLQKLHVYHSGLGIFS